MSSQRLSCSQNVLDIALLSPDFSMNARAHRFLFVQLKAPVRQVARVIRNEETMMRAIAIVALMLAPALAAAADGVPSWAFFVPDPNAPAMKAPAGLRTVPGSARSYTQTQIDDLKNPPDWFPAAHPPMPAPVAGGGDGLACASCHLVSGMGHPQNSSLAGKPAAYLERQVADFKSGARRNPIVVDGKPQINSLQFMVDIAKSLSPKDAKIAAEYFAKLKPKTWVQVVETAAVPKTCVTRDYMRVTTPAGGSEPLGKRIVELPQDLDRQLMRDPNSGTIAYVPLGSVSRGKALASTGPIRCTVCHGADLKGVDEIPSIVGQSPVSVFRQLYFFKEGIRNGSFAALMMPSVASLSQDDMIDLAAYLGSLSP